MGANAGQCGKRFSMTAMILDLEVRPLVHLLLHALVPLAIALAWFQERWWQAWLWMLAGWLIDVDHLLADPVYAPGRSSIGFHPLHTAPAIGIYALLCVPRRSRLLGIGLVIHIVLDWIDCLMM